MSKAKVSWLLCIGRLVSKTDNVMHFARLVKQASVDLVSDPFGLWAVCYGAQSPDATLGTSSRDYQLKKSCFLANYTDCLLKCMLFCEQIWRNHITDSLSHFPSFLNLICRWIICHTTRARTPPLETMSHFILFLGNDPIYYSLSAKNSNGVIVSAAKWT